MNRLARLLSLFGSTSTLCACVAISSVQTADTLGAGRLQVGLEPGVAGVVQTSTGVVLAPAADVAVRYGAAERLDVGARLGQSGLELQLKVMVTPPGTRVAVSLAPHLAGQLRFVSNLSPESTPGVGVAGLLVNGGLPLLVGVRLGPHQLVLGPRVHVLASVPSSAAEPGSRHFATGGSVGVSLRVSRSVAVMPEVALLVPLSPGPPVATTDTFSQLSAGLLVQTRLAFLLGDSAQR